MIDYHEAIVQMHKGFVVQYVGTANGPVWNLGHKFCMQRGVVFIYHHAKNIDYQTCGHMVYDPDFRYELTGETVDPRGWPQRESVKPEMGYSRIGLGNV